MKIASTHQKQLTKALEALKPHTTTAKKFQRFTCTTNENRWSDKLCAISEVSATCILRLGFNPM